MGVGSLQRQRIGPSTFGILRDGVGLFSSQECFFLKCGHDFLPFRLMKSGGILLQKKGLAVVLLVYLGVITKTHF